MSWVANNMGVYKKAQPMHRSNSPVKVTEGKYKVYKDDGSDEPIEIDAENDDEALEKIKRITGKDPKKVTYYKDTNEASTTDAVPPHDGDPEDIIQMRVSEILANCQDILDRSIREASYTQFKSDDGSPKQKINATITSVNRYLYEIERMITHASKLRNESGLSHDVFWKSTVSNFNKICDRMLRINAKIREFNA